MAERFNLLRPSIPNLPLPAAVSEEWIGSRMRELRRELEREDEMSEDEKVDQPEVEREMVETREPVREEREHELAGTDGE